MRAKRAWSQKLKNGVLRAAGPIFLEYKGIFYHFGDKLYSVINSAAKLWLSENSARYNSEDKNLQPFSKIYNLFTTLADLEDMSRQKHMDAASQVWKQPVFHQHYTPT